MKKTFCIALLIVAITNADAQIIDWKKFDLNNLIGKALVVQKGFAPKFKLGNIDVAKIANVTKIINLKNISTATKLFNTFKNGRALYRIGSITGAVASAYGVIKNSAESNKEATNVAAQQAKAAAIKKAQNLAIAGGSTIALGLIVKFITKAAAHKAANAFNGAIRKKITDILSFDAPTISPYTSAGLAIKIKL